MTEQFIVTVALAGLVTLALKSAFIEGQHYFRLPQWFVDALEFVPPAILFLGAEDAMRFQYAASCFHLSTS